MNGNFAAAGIPPFYNNQQFASQADYVYSGPVPNQFTYTNVASDIQYYRPVSSVTSTVVENALPGTVFNPIVQRPNVEVVENGRFNNGWNTMNSMFNFF